MNAKQILTTVASAIAMSLIGNVAQAQADCPKAGELKNFAQITAQAEIFNGCDVTTEVNFVATGQGNISFSARGYNLEGMTVFLVMPLGQQVNSAPLCLDAAFAVSLPNDKADPIFTVKTGDKLRLRGSMEYRKFNGYDTAMGSRLFRAQSIEVVQK